MAVITVQTILPKLEVTDYYKNMTLYISTVGSHPII
jgi:hypothetical protein